MGLEVRLNDVSIIWLIWRCFYGVSYFYADERGLESHTGSLQSCTYHIIYQRIILCFSTKMDNLKQIIASLFFIHWLI